MKKVIYLFVGILTLMFVASCNNEEPVVVDPAAELVEVSFDVDDFFPDIAAKGTPKDGVPVCNDLGIATTAKVGLKLGTGSIVEYTLDILPVNNGMETEVLKLVAGIYSVESFVIFDQNGAPLHASTTSGSAYATAWPDLTSLPFPIDVEGFTKKKFNIDVLCYQPYDYVNFGFAWFEYAEYEIKTICFFGDVCTKFWEEWRDSNGSPYANSITGYDFRAGFMVELFTADGTAINTGNSNIYSPDGIVEADGSISPLCVEYPHMVGSGDAITFKISLLMFDNTYLEIHTGAFTSGAYSGDGTWGGNDDVFDFVVGNCSADDTDADIDAELPAYIPVAKTGKFKLTGSEYDSAHGGYYEIQFDNLDLEHADTFMNATSTSAVYGAFCAAKVDDIWLNKWYTANFYSSLGDLSELDPIRYAVLKANIGKLNWIVNNIDANPSWTLQQIQAAVWHFTDAQGANAISALADSFASYVPPVGGWAVVICDIDETVPQPRPATDFYQLMIVRVDP